MGFNHSTTYSHRRVHLMISLIFLIVSSSTQVRFMVEGRPIFKLIEDAQIGGEEKLIMRGVIGSRPPRCDRRCRTCGHCEAVQVPIVPQDKDKSPKVSGFASVGESRYDYKPMSWKCKCGNMFYNP